MLEEFGLLVAARQGEFAIPPHFSHKVRPLLMNDGFDDVSATEVRRRIAAGEPWEHLVPPEILTLVRQIYSSTLPGPYAPAATTEPRT